MNRNNYKYLLLAVALTAPLLLSAFDANQAKSNLLAHYYARELGVNQDQISILLIHVADIDSNLLQQHRISVEPRPGHFNLGHQTLWLVERRGSLINRRFPITLNVTAELVIPVAKRNIKRLELLTEQNIELQTVRLGHSYTRVIRDSNQLLNKMAVQALRAGKPIERNMVRIQPDVQLGDELQVVLQNQGLALQLPGIAKQEGQIGDEIKVQCPSARKEFKGTLSAGKQVLVSLRR